MRLLKNLKQHSARKVGKNAHTINKNRLVDNHNTGLVGKIKKSKEFIKRRSITSTQSQAHNVDIPRPNPGTNSQITKK